MNKSIYYIPQSSPKQHFKVRGIEIKYIEAKDYSAKLYLRGKEVIAPIGLGDLEKILSSEYFCRIHRSYIVQLQKVDKFTPETVIIEDIELPIGEAYSYDFLNKVQILSKNQTKLKMSKGGIAVFSEMAASFLGEIF